MTLICKNCHLFNAKESVCDVSIIMRGEVLELKVASNDECFWQKNGIKVRELDAKKEIASL